MKRIGWVVVLGSLVAVIAGCGAPAAQLQQPESATGTQEEAALAALAPTSAPSTSVGEATAILSPPATEQPAPTSTSIPPTEEPTSTSAPPLTATQTVPPPTPAPTDTPVAVTSADDIQRIVPGEAKALLDSGSAVLYDVRTEAEYRAQHAAGAVSFPGAGAAARYGELPADKALVFY